VRSALSICVNGKWIAFLKPRPSTKEATPNICSSRSTIAPSHDNRLHCFLRPFGAGLIKTVLCPPLPLFIECAVFGVKPSNLQGAEESGSFVQVTHYSNPQASDLNQNERLLSIVRGYYHISRNNLNSKNLSILSCVNLLCVGMAVHMTEPCHPSIGCECGNIHAYITTQHRAQFLSRAIYLFLRGME
jgi:hypothetical protein